MPAENIERDAANSSASGAAQKARERAAKLAAKLAAEGKLATGIPPPPIIVSKRLSVLKHLKDVTKVDFCVISIEHFQGGLK